MDKSWIEVERGETTNLFRKKLEELNDIEAKHLDCDDIKMINMIYETMYTMCKHKKLEHEMSAVKHA